MTTDTWWIKLQPHDTKHLRKGDRILMPDQNMLERYIEELPAGSRSTVKEMRAALADRHGCAVTCPVTTNLHLTAMAEEALVAREPLPIWRTVEAAATALKRAGIPDDWIEGHRKAERH